MTLNLLYLVVSELLVYTLKTAPSGANEDHTEPSIPGTFSYFSNSFSHKTLTSCVCILSNTACFLNETQLNLEPGGKVKGGGTQLDIKKTFRNPCTELD